MCAAPSTCSPACYPRRKSRTIASSSGLTQEPRADADPELVPAVDLASGVGQDRRSVNPGADRVRLLAVVAQPIDNRGLGDLGVELDPTYRCGVKAKRLHATIA